MVTPSVSASPSRKRMRVVMLVAVCAAICPESSTGFLSAQQPPTAGVVARTKTATTRIAPLSILAAAKPSKASGSAPPRLTPAEERDLLAQAVELRRIKKVESDMALQSSSSQPVSRLAVSRAAGYDLTEELEAAIDRGHAARETLVTRNMGLVHYCVNNIIGTTRQQRRLQSLSREDLIQEGAIGLARAVDKWNIEIGGKFSTYAVYWVRAAVLRCIAERDDLMRVPEHMSVAVRKLSRAAQTLGLEIDGDEILSTVYSSSDASWKAAKAAKALAEESGLSDRQLVQAMKVRQRRSAGILSYEAWMQQGKDFETDLTPVVSEDEAALASSFESEQLKETLSQFLRPREMEALSWRYGLMNEEQTAAAHQAPPRDYVAEVEEALYGGKKQKDDIPVRGKRGEAMSFVEVGKKMKVSAEYGRRLCHAALNKLRQAADDGKLEPALLY